MKKLATLATAVLVLMACSGGGGNTDATGTDTAGEATLPDVAADAPDAGDDALFYDGTSVKDASVTNGKAALHVLQDPFRISLWYDGVERAVLPAFSLGTVAEYRDETNYDPSWFYRGLDGKPAEKLPAGFAREVVTGFVSDPVEDGDGLQGMRLLLETDLHRHLVLRVLPEGEAGFRLELTPDATGPEGLPTPVTTALQWPMAEGENYYGSGERFDAVALRGTFAGLQFEALASESGYNEAHVPVPFAVSTHGWGLYVEERRPGVLDFGTIEADHARFEFMNDRMTVHLLAADTPLEVVGGYTAISGRPNIPAWWAFAPQQWRNEVNGTAEVMDDLAKARQHGVPVGVMWIDRPWEKTYHDFVFDPARFAEPQAMLDELRAQGIRTIVWTAPYQTPASDVFAAFEAQGLFVDRPAGWPTASYSDEVELVDFSNPAVTPLWTDLMRRVTDMGIEGFKFDYGEDVQVGLASKRVHFAFANGEDERTMHHEICRLWHKVAHDLLGHGHGFLMARSGMPGGQAVVNAIWPGDLDNDFSYRLEKVDGQVMTGGLPAAIRASLSLSASGYPVFSSDTGGFRNGRPAKEVLLRWVEHTALTPVLQFGGGGSNHNPWDFEGKGDEAKYDQETLDVFARYARLHMDLFPYVFSYAMAAASTGVPIQRPFGLQEPADGRHPDDQYFFGEHLFVAPVERAETTKTVELPSGTWVDWWTGEVVQGPTTLTRDAPLDTLPLFARAGSVIPLLQPGVQTVSNNLELDPEHLAASDLALRVRVTLGADGAFTLYDGASLSLAGATPVVTFQPGTAFQRADLEVVPAAATVSAVQLATTGAAEALAEVQDAAAWEACAEGCWWRDPATGHVLVHTPADAHAFSVTLAP